MNVLRPNNEKYFISLKGTASSRECLAFTYKMRQMQLVCGTTAYHERFQTPFDQKASAFPIKTVLFLH